MFGIGSSVFGNSSGGGFANVGDGFVSHFDPVMGQSLTDANLPRLDAQFRNQKKLQDAQNQTELQKQAAADSAANQRAQISANASTLPALLQQERFNKVFPGLFNQTQSFNSVGGTNAPLPEVTVGPVYTPQQTQEQVNAGRAQNDRATAQQQLQSQQQLAGKGFGATSPLLAGLQSQQAMAGMQANSELERGLRFDTAKDNAQHLLQSQTERQNQWTQNEDSDIRRRQVQQTGYNSLLQALAGII